MRTQLLALVLAGLFALAACNANTPAASSTAAQPSQTAQPATAQAPWKMQLTTDPVQPTSEQNATFRVKLTDESGAPVTGAKLQAELVMRSMDMGKTEVPLADKSNGLYEGQGKFTMAGPWNVVVTATKDGKSATQTFEIVAKRY